MTDETAGRTTDERLETYIDAHTDGESDYLYRLWRATNVHTIHGRMVSGHLQGRLLKMLVMMQRPRYVLEVGTFSGYSAICMAEGLKELDDEAGANGAENRKKREGEAAANDVPAPARKLFTFEINDEMEDFTRPWIEGSAVAPYIDFRIGDAITEAPKLGLRFDLAFIDGDKRTYVETYDAVLPLMNPGGIILADNTLWDGHVVDHAYDRDQQTVGIRRFNDYIKQDRRVEEVILPIRDGLTLIRVKAQ
jgi:predicted O-methyltransferase YrrM